MSGLAGAAGVALAARAAHGDSQYASQISTMLLLHAPAFLAIGLAIQPVGRFMSLAAGLLAIGLLLFCGDLAWREFQHARLFPMAAPVGGGAMIAGWLGIAISALTRKPA